MQLTLFDNPSVSNDWQNSDDWETPLHESEIFAEVFYEILGNHAVNLLEIGAGNGNITKAMCQRFSKGLSKGLSQGVSLDHHPHSHTITAIEPKPQRYKNGKLTVPQVTWYNDTLKGYLDSLKDPQSGFKFNIVYGNPPFSKEVFTEIWGLICTKIKPEYIVWLLPTTFWQTEWGNTLLKTSAYRFYDRYEFVGRVSFLKNGIAKKGRQCYDAIHFLKAQTPSP